MTRYLRTVAVDRHGPDPLRAPEPEMVAALVQDLRNGMAVHPTSAGLVLADTIPPTDRTQIASSLSRRGLAVAPE